MPSKEAPSKVSPSKSARGAVYRAVLLIEGKGVKSLLIIFSILERNEAQLRGGAIYLENSSLDIEVNTRFTASVRMSNRF